MTAMSDRNAVAKDVAKRLGNYYRNSL